VPAAFNAPPASGLFQIPERRMLRPPFLGRGKIQGTIEMSLQGFMLPSFEINNNLFELEGFAADGTHILLRICHGLLSKNLLSCQMLIENCLHCSVW
jgi:hypothetical protein